MRYHRSMFENSQRTYSGVTKLGKSVIVNRLRLGNEFVGYRFDIVSGKTKVVSFDVADDMYKTLLFMIKEQPQKGTIIDGQLHGDVFTAGDETNVVEVDSIEKAKEVIYKYGVNDDVSSSNDAQVVSFVHNWNYTSQDFQSLVLRGRVINGCKKFKNIPEAVVAEGYLSKAMVGVNACLRYEDGAEVVNAIDGSPVMGISCTIVFCTVFEYLKFIYNMAHLTGRNSIFLSIAAVRRDREGKPLSTTNVARSFQCDSLNSFIQDVLKACGASDCNMWRDGNEFVSVTYCNDGLGNLFNAYKDIYRYRFVIPYPVGYKCKEIKKKCENGYYISYLHDGCTPSNYYKGFELLKPYSPAVPKSSDGINSD